MNAETSPATEIRLDQVGYMPGEAKRAFAMSEADLTGIPFRVVDVDGRAVFRGVVDSGSDRGRWSPAFPHVHQLDFAGLREHGVFTVVLDGEPRIESTAFAIGAAPTLFGPAVADVAGFFAAQRDGDDVIPGELSRRAAHLDDREATVYETTGLFPFEDGEVPALLTPVTRDGCELRIDASGGWFDAGDYLKFVQTTSYAVALLAVAEALSAETIPGLAAEIDHGLAWLDRMWDGEHGVLYAQVGLGKGNDDIDGLRFVGDHQAWRLPEADDTLDIDRDAVPGSPGAEEYFLRYRPVFAANQPGERISPNLAGRVSACFALAAQRTATADPAVATAWYEKARAVYALADISWTGALVTTQPFEYYPESDWLDDMTLGAAELARAGALLGDRRTADALLGEAAGFAARFDDGGLLNLYDTSALAGAELVLALRERRQEADAPQLRELAISEDGLIERMRRTGLDAASARSAADPFGAVADYADYDVVSTSFGVIATALLFERLTGEKGCAETATAARNWVLGANAWGQSFVIGVGSSFPQHPHHQIGNLLGAGTGALLRGAVVNGPNGSAATEVGNQDWYEGQAVVGPSDMTSDPLARYHSPEASDADGRGPEDGCRGSRFLDWSGSWATVEPAIDFSATALLALALLSASGQEAEGDL